ncbi:MAG: carbon-nitrogen family hydrolase [Planctomycetes bacterium]|nr:carbon-nitrogen family hydrolase [Planctomycetota bacterium]
MSKTKEVRAAAIQWDVQRGDTGANLAEAERLILEAHEDDARIVVLPELWTTSFVGDDVAAHRGAIDDAERKLAQMSGDLDLVATGSSYEIDADGRVYNTATVWEDGNVLGRYRKAHLFSPHGEDRMFSPGESPLVVDTKFGRAAIAICYDLRFPELIRELALTEALMLLVPAQWPEPRERHWNVLSRARAIEEQWFVIGTNRCGVEPSLMSDQDITYPGNSLIVSPTGEVLAEGDGEPRVVAADLRLKECSIIRRAIPVYRDRRPDFYARVHDELTGMRPVPSE